MQHNLSVTVSVVTWNRLEMTRCCLESLLATKASWWRLAVVDNGSSDGTQEYLQNLKKQGALDFLALLRTNMGVSAAQNLAWANLPGTHYVKVDNDVVAEHPAWLERLVQAASAQNKIGMAGYCFCPWHHGNTVQLADGQDFLQGTTCGGGCVCIPNFAHKILGFWNEDYAPYGYEDNEYGFRANQAELITGYLPVSLISTLDQKGEERTRQDDYTKGKLAAVDTDQARSLWFVNLFLFQHGIRPLYVEQMRKAIPPASEEKFWHFRPNPDYQRIRIMQKTVAASDAFQKWFATMNHSAQADLA